MFFPFCSICMFSCFFHTYFAFRCPLLPFISSVPVFLHFRCCIFHFLSSCQGSSSPHRDSQSSRDSRNDTCSSWSWRRGRRCHDHDNSVLPHIPPSDRNSPRGSSPIPPHRYTCRPRIYHVLRRVLDISSHCNREIPIPESTDT